MTSDDIEWTVEDFGDAVKLAKEAGFDAVEVHAGHGYLVSQFLSPYTNKRTDEFGGSLDNRMRFMRRVIGRVREAAGTDTAVLVKMNLRDGFEGGMELDESLVVAKTLTELGADALILSGGFVSRAPMFLMRGDSIAPVMKHFLPFWLRWGLAVAGPWMIPAVAYSPTFFMDDAKKVRAALPHANLVYVGGVSSRSDADAALEAGFDAVAIARSLIREPDFVNRLKSDEANGSPGESRCDHCNYCAARIYTTYMACHRAEEAPVAVRHLLPK
jgi:2,4-dienoyl-CoA reductase-like NADH-dependent reductase (Old Yellow Enzyme family)